MNHLQEFRYYVLLPVSCLNLWGRSGATEPVQF